MAWFSNLMKKTFNVQAAPNQVVEVKTDKYDERPIICREEGIFLYDGSGELKYDIVMHKPFSQSLSDGYSLFRSEERHLAEERFILLKDKLPILMNITSVGLSVIQKYCDTIREHPSWNVCHLAVHFNITEAFATTTNNSTQILSLVNTPCALSGVSPLQVAVQSGNLALIHKLISLGADLAHLDHNANSVYHYAAITNKDIINALTSKDENLLRGLNQRNVTGYTPLHIACLDDKPDCVIALISKGADVNLSAGSPAHRIDHSANQPAGEVASFLQDTSDPKIKGPKLIYEVFEMNVMGPVG